MCWRLLVEREAVEIRKGESQYEDVLESMKSFKKDIENRDFPTEKHSYEAGELTEDNIKEWKKEVKKILS